MQVGSLSTLEKKLFSIITTTKQSKPASKSIQGQPSNQSPNSLTISYIMMQKMPPQIKKILEDSFQNIIELAIINCDLRTFQNFPKLKSLRNLNVSKNSLRGSFQFVVKNRTIKYIDASNNMISDIKKFQPLRCLKEVSLYAKFNPFDCREEMQTNTRSGGNIVEQLKGYGVKYLDKPLIINKEKQKQKQKQIKKQQKQPKPSNEPPLLKRPSQIFQSMLKQRRQKKMLERSLHQHLQEEENYLRTRFPRRESEIQAMLNSGSLEIFNNMRRVGLRDSSSSSEQNNNNNNATNNRNSGQNSINNLNSNSNPSINPQPQAQPTFRQSLGQPQSQSVPQPAAVPQPVASEISISSFSSDEQLILQINNMDDFNNDEQQNDNENQNEDHQDNYDDNENDNDNGDGNQDDDDQDEPFFHPRFLNLDANQEIFDVLQDIGDRPRQLLRGRRRPRLMLPESEENEDFQVDSDEDDGPVL